MPIFFFWVYLVIYSHSFLFVRISLYRHCSIFIDLIHALDIYCWHSASIIEAFHIIPIIILHFSYQKKSIFIEKKYIYIYNLPFFLKSIFSIYLNLFCVTFVSIYPLAGDIISSLLTCSWLGLCIDLQNWPLYINSLRIFILNIFNLFKYLYCTFIIYIFFYYILTKKNYIFIKILIYNINKYWIKILN